MRFQRVLASLPCLALVGSAAVLPKGRHEDSKQIQSDEYWQSPPMDGPQHSVYPSKNNSDAPYSVNNETALRDAIKINKYFLNQTNAEPVIFIPGTDIKSSQVFEGNYLNLNTDFGKHKGFKPVILEIPDMSNGDCQVTAEYVAYAINYIAEISGNRKVNIIAWSQGSVNTQWALKYWPSTRELVKDFISISGVMKGSTKNEEYWGPWKIRDLWTSWPPAIFQQAYDSNFIKTLRSRDGDSAYVPTTAIYTSDDHIAKPQTSDSRATGYFNDTRGVGVSNTLVQDACPGQPAGTHVTHQEILDNPLTMALVLDALSHPGPANISRLNLKDVCANRLAPGMVQKDVREKTSLLYDIWVNNWYYRRSLYVAHEPPVKHYAY